MPLHKSGVQLERFWKRKKIARMKNVLLKNLQISTVIVGHSVIEDTQAPAHTLTCPDLPLSNAVRMARSMSWWPSEPIRKTVIWEKMRKTDGNKHKQMSVFHTSRSANKCLSSWTVLLLLWQVHEGLQHKENSITIRKPVECFPLLY